MPKIVQVVDQRDRPLQGEAMTELQAVSAGRYSRQMTTACYQVDPGALRKLPLASSPSLVAGMGRKTNMVLSGSRIISVSHKPVERLLG